jgi:hypothetical protein
VAEEDDKKFTQADVDRMIESRLAREKGKKPDDYDELKAKAAKLDEQEAQNKTELERERDLRKAADLERDKAKADVVRFEIAAEKGVKPRYITGSTREELEASADEYLKDHPKPGVGEGEEETTITTGRAAAKPTEDLKGGGDPTKTGEQQPVETDPAKLAATVPRT